MSVSGVKMQDRIIANILMATLCLVIFEIAYVSVFVAQPIQKMVKTVATHTNQINTIEQLLAVHFSTANAREIESHYKDGINGTISAR